MAFFSRNKVGIAERVAELKALEVERKRTQQALRESEKKYRELVNSLPQIVFEMDANGLITFANLKAFDLLGYTQDDIDKGLNALEMIIPQDRNKTMENIQRVLNGEEATDCEYTIFRKDGSKISVVIHINPIIGENRSACFRGIMIDISDRKQAEEEKKKLEVQLHQAQKMESIGTLAGGIAHDFNNVLSSIIGFTELTMYDVTDGSSVKKNLQHVLKAALRAKDMVQQILAFSRKADIEKKPIKVQKVVNDALKMLRTSIPSTIEIHQNINSDCSPVLADATQIHQVVMNLATNAYQAMREKGGVLELALKEEKIGFDDSDPDLGPGTYLKLTVSDTGHGMDEVVMEKIFDPYFTTKSPGEGTGIGLAVALGIVKSHGGSIKVYSKIGEGTAFHIYLPLIETRPCESRAITAEPVPTGTERILFVDDESDIVYMTQQILERLGYQVTSRTSSVEAFEAFRVKPDEYDLVITDMTMPNMTGVELARMLKKIKFEIPIIICSGFSEMIDEDKAKAIGINAYIMKPIVINDIARITRKVLDEEKEK